MLQIKTLNPNKQFHNLVESNICGVMVILINFFIL